MYIYITVVSVVLYGILQFMDDKRNAALNKPQSTIGTKIAIFIFTVIITTTIFYLFWDEQANGYDHGELQGQSGLKYINQEIETGFPKF